MTNQEMRQLAASMDLKGIRKACGISGVRIARALGVQPHVICWYEKGRGRPVGERGVRYMRIMLALRNHLEVPEGEPATEGSHDG